MNRKMTLNDVRKNLTRGAVLALVVVGQVAWAQVSGLAKRVDIFLKDADLLQATQMLTRQTGIQFVIAPSVSEYGKINLSLNGVSAEDAIKYICQAAGCWAERDANGVFVIRQGEAPASSNSNSSNPFVKKPKKIDRIKVINADVRNVYSAIFKGVVIDPDQGFRNVDLLTSPEGRNLAASMAMPATTIGPGGTVIMNPGVSTPTISSRVTDTTLPKDSGQLSTSGNDVLLPGETVNQVRGGGSGGGSGPGSGGGGTNGGGSTALQAGTGFTPDGITKVTYDPTDNSLIVEGDDDAIQQLRQLVAMFDQVPKQVIIKVEFITTSQSVTKSLGMDWLYQRGAINAGNRPGTFSRSSDPIFINYATGNITTRLRTILTEGQGKVVNAPLVRTLNNQIAAVSESTLTYIFVNQTVNGPGGIQVNSTPVPITITTQLVVRPRINDDGYVTMSLSPSIQDFGQQRRGPNGEELNDQLQQSINVVARVKSGETIALAGLTRKQTTNSISRFPILSDLPIIGQLFKSTSTQRNDSELLIFVTPIIVEDETNGGLAP